MKHNPWLHSPSHSALVPIPLHNPTHSLFASISSPSLHPHQSHHPNSPPPPLLIFITGAGAPIAFYTALHRHLTSTLSIRCLFYDRAGYDKSTRDPSPLKKSIMAMDSAVDLWDLLVAMGVRTSTRLIIAAHSYGGIIAREFLALALDRRRVTPINQNYTLSGLILLDTATELLLTLFPRVPSVELETLGQGVDFAALTNFVAESGLTQDEVEEAVKAQERTAPAATDEDNHGSARCLAERRQLDLGVMRHLEGSYLVVLGTNLAGDYKLIYEEGLKRGNGTEEEREKAREFVEVTRLFQRQVGRVQLDLMGEDGRRGDGRRRARYVWLADMGHDAPLRIKKTDCVGEAVRWVLGRMEEGEEWGA